jgi:hypothetical protein
VPANVDTSQENNESHYQVTYAIMTAIGPLELHIRSAEGQRLEN